MSGSGQDWHRRFVRVLTVWTAVVHVPLGVAVGMALRGWVGWVGWTIGMGLWVASVLALRPLVTSGLPDRPRSRWRVDLLERPYLIHWSATHLGLVGWIVGFVAAIVASHPPAPTWWALGAYASALVVFSWGAFVTSRRLRVRSVDVSVRGLPREFDGFRVAHLTDLHVGSFTPPELVAGWLDRVQREGPDMTVITGDLVTSGVAFHEAIAQLVGSLSSPAGVYFVPGNHDYFGDGQPLFGWMRDRGVHVLRNEHVVLERAGAIVIVAGVDDLWTERFDLEAALRDRPSGVTLLLAHDPLLFEEAARRGVEVVLSGHTHGGQIGVPGLARWINLTKMSNPYSLGIYRKKGSTLVVSGGMGCTGLPIRVGVPPEVLILRLRRAPSL